MIKVLKKVFLPLWLLVFLALIFIGFRGIKMESQFYWWILVGLIFLIWQYKIISKILFIIAFCLFIFSAALVTVGLNTIAEILMRLSFTLWIVGFGKALLENQKGRKTNES